ncbi:MAG: ferritin family protein [Peptococcaceae bacterium]
MYKNVKEIELIKTALLNEKEGEIFYKMAAGQAENESVQEALLFLAEEEVKHGEWLRNVYRKLINEKQFSLEAMVEAEERSPEIFTAATQHPETGSLAVSVFGIGIKMEKASIDYYQNAAATTEIKELQGFYRRLVDWEKGHLKMLEKIYDQLKEEWWDKQGFSPA